MFFYEIQADRKTFGMQCRKLKMGYNPTNQTIHIGEIHKDLNPSKFLKRYLNDRHTHEGLYVTRDFHKIIIMQKNLQCSVGLTNMTTKTYWPLLLKRFSQEH